MAEARAARFVVAFAATLRRAGLEVPAGSVVVYAEALAAVGLEDRETVYFAGLATLVRRPEDRTVYDRVFAEFFDDRALFGFPRRPTELVIALDDEEGEEPAGEEGEDVSADASIAVRYSPIEVLRHEDFSRYRDEDWDEARRLISSLRSRAETRPSRRLRPGRHASGSLDLPRTVRAALASDGETMRRSYRARSERPRRLVFLVDVSGSMEPYARAFLRFAHAAASSRAAGGVEVFTFGTRVTRITRQLATRDPDAALAEAGAAVEDWFGGTKLGDGLGRFNDRWGTRGVARGAVVVVLSDGWDRGDPEVLGREMARLSRVARRIVWVNPLRATPGYAPVARGMAAALPFVDDFVDGHSLASLEALVDVVAGSPRHRSDTEAVRLR